MPVQFSCPECKAVLKSAKPIPAGKQLTCPKCGVLFLMPAEDAPPDEDEVLDATVMSERDEADDDDRPRRKPVRRRAAVDDEDEYDDEDDDRPRRKKKKFSKKKSGGSSGLVIAMVGGVVALLILAGVGVLGFMDISAISWSGFFRSYVNKGTGDEEALAYVPADSDVVGGMDFDELQRISPQLYTQATQGFQPSGPVGDSFLTQIKESLGIEQKDLLGRLTYAAKMPQGQQAMVPQLGPGVAAGAPGMVAVFKTQAPMDQKRLHRFYNAHNIKMQKYNGKIFYKEPAAAGSSGNWVFLPSDHTLVLMPGSASEEEWHKVLDSDGKTVALSGSGWELLSQQQAGAFWTVLAVKGEMRDQMLQGLKGGAAAMFDLKGLTDALAKVQCAGFSLGAQNDQYVLSIQAGSSSASAAKKLRTELENFYAQTVKGAMGQMVIQQLTQRLPQDKAQLLTDLINKVKFHSHGNVATVSLSIAQSTFKDALQDLQRMGSPQGRGRPGRGMPRGRFGRPNMPRGRSGRPGGPGARPGAPPFGAGR